MGSALLVQARELFLEKLNTGVIMIVLTFVTALAVIWSENSRHSDRDDGVEHSTQLAARGV